MFLGKVGACFCYLVDTTTALAGDVFIEIENKLLALLSRIVLVCSSSFFIWYVIEPDCGNVVDEIGRR